MRSILAFLVTSFAFLPVSAFARNDVVKIGSAPTWAQVSEPMAVPDDARGSIFVRRNNVEIHVDKSGQFTFTSVLAKLLDTNALQLGNFAISWNPAAGTPVVHAIKIHRNGIVRDVLQGAEFEILRREDQLEAATLDGILTAALRIPDLRVGDELELAYTLPSHDPTMRSSSYGLLFLAPVTAPGRLGLRLSWEAGEEPIVRPSSDVAPNLKREPQAVSLNFDMPPALSLPKDAPQRYNWRRVVEFSDFATWPIVSSRIAPLFEKAVALPGSSAVRTEAAAIAAAHSGSLERAAAALKLVQQQVRYVYVGLNGGNLTPSSAEETWQRRFGDCKGKTALLLALLRELGIQSEAVLVSNAGLDDGIDERLPAPGYFDHVLVRARIDGKTFWLDGTLPQVYRPTEGPVLPYRWVLPLSAEGAMIEQLAWAPDTKPGDSQLFEIDARAGFASLAKRRIVSIARGRKALEEYLQYSSATDTQLEDAFRNQLEGSEGWTTVEKVTWRFDPKELASVLEIRGAGPIDWDDEGGQSRSMSLPGGGFSPPRRRQRSETQDSSVPYSIEPEFSCSVTTVRLPSTTSKNDWSFNTSYNRVLFGQTFQRNFELRDGAIRMVRSNRTLQTEIDTAAAVRDNASIADFDNSMAWIYYDPGSNVPARSTGRVPAIDEIDWTVDPGACLSAAQGGS